MTRASLYDPATGRATATNAPDLLFCGGQTILADGRVLVVGGKLLSTSVAGVHQPGAKVVYTFDPTSGAWQRQPDTPLGRYYPSVTELADGRALITNGDKVDASLNTSIEVFNPATRKLQQVGSRTIDLYAHQWVLPNGRVLAVGHKAALAR